MTNAPDSLAAPSLVGRRPILVTGGAGFIGSNLADRLAAEGHDVLVYDALSRPGVEVNLEWLRRRHSRRVSAAVADIRDEAALSEAVSDACAVFHLAAQVAVTTSLESPRDDFDVNLLGTLLLLEALRRKQLQTPLIFASTNKVYGDLADIGLQRLDEAYVPSDPAVRTHGIGEDRPLDLQTPYACSKGGADQYVLDYSRSFGLPTAVFRMSCIYGPRQMGTEYQGWVAHFILRALKEEPITIYGDGCQVCDILFVDDAVDAYVAAWRHMNSVRGHVFNLGGGPANAVSLKQVISHIADLIGRPVPVEYAGWRKGDQRYYVSDARRASSRLGLGLPKPWRVGISTLVRWLEGERNLRAPSSGLASATPSATVAHP